MKFALAVIGFAAVSQATEVVEGLKKGIPTAVFHGFGDECNFPGMWEFTWELSQGTGAYAECVEIGGDGIGEGSLTSIFSSFKWQAEQACEKVKANKHFQGEFNVVGLSQGGLLARSIVQQCDTNETVRNFVTLGGPHRGVAASPNCFSGFYCDIINYTIDTFVYFPTIQDFIAPAAYFRDPEQLDTYYKYSIFLPYLNNEKDFDQKSKDRLVAVNKAMFGWFSQDTVIDPPETAIFGELQIDRSVKDVHDTDLYKNDLIGLAQLEAANKITWKKIEGNHLQFTEDFVQHELIPFLMQ